MQPIATHKRLQALDGIRGIAIIFVVLTHINAVYSDTLAKVFSPWMVRLIFGSGITGVSMLFVLSGFFMSLMYPHPKSTTVFLQKRYTRIFPLFLTMSSVSMILRLFPTMKWYEGLGLMLLAAVSTYAVWIFVVKKFFNNRYKSLLFFLFLFLQIGVGLFYTFWVSKQPAIVFNQQIPALLRETTIWLTNATLMLPFGNYIPMIDGVYWSLAAEILFYIFYPIVCVPLVDFFTPFSKKVKLLGLFCVLCFFAGLDSLSHNILQLSMLQLPLCYYFITGITLGYLYRNRGDFLQKISIRFLKNFSFLSIFLFFFVIFIKLVFLTSFPFISSWIHLLWAFPITFLIALALDRRMVLTKMLETKFFVYIGTISYSIYLSHAPIISLLSQLTISKNTWSQLIFICIILVIIVGISHILHFLLENPYFQKSHQTSQLPYAARTSFIAKPGLVIVSLISLYLFFVISIYQSRFNFFSFEYSYPSSIFSFPSLATKNISMKDYPTVILTIPAMQNNFEAITLHIAHKSSPYKTYIPQTLMFQIKQVSQKNWFATDSFDLTHIAESTSHPFGFPVIQDSKGKTYTIHLSLLSKQSSEYIMIDSINYLRGIYAMDKKQLFTHPVQLLQFILAKISLAVQNPQAQYALLLETPFALLSVMLLWRGKAFR